MAQGTGRFVAGLCVRIPVRGAVRCAATSIVRPFVFRKYLDFGAIAALRELHKLIRAEAVRRSVERKGRTTAPTTSRLGAAEFASSNSSRRLFRSCAAAGIPNCDRSRRWKRCRALSELGVLPAATCERLAVGYVFLRNFEHALQYVDDAQTHRVPSDMASRECVARLLGASSAAAMMAEYRAVQALVAEVFDGVFAEPAVAEDEVSSDLGNV